MSEVRWLATPAGGVSYEFSRKRVKNINLRVREDGSVAVSAPLRMSLRDVEAFLRQKAGWIDSCRAAALAAPTQGGPPLYSKQECLALFTRLSDEVFPLFSTVLGGHKPLIKVRDMKSRWGSCNIKTRCITLNQRLAEKPPAAIEYVVLHEYVHFLHPDHSPAFHAQMARLMPDYKARRALLR